jgi:hypothetical protein
MAVSINRVYQKVLAFANKEQRGYITPQEFNLFAHQAQMEIFEQYFYDINQWNRQHGNSVDHSDMLTNLEGKVSYFKRYDRNVSSVTGIHGDVMLESHDESIYRLMALRLRHKAGDPLYVAEEMQVGEETFLYQSSPLTISTKKRPIYWKRMHAGQGVSLRIYPKPQISNPYDSSVDGTVVISYIRTPVNPNWGYVVVNDKALYNSTSSTDFELHASEESELVYRILAYAGISIGKPEITQVASQALASQIQQEKQ